MEEKDLNLLNEALGLHNNNNNLYCRFVLVEDCVDTSAVFVLHHILKRSFSTHPSSAVLFLALSNPFSHYDRILRKLVILSPFLCIYIWNYFVNFIVNCFLSLLFLSHFFSYMCVWYLTIFVGILGRVAIWLLKEIIIDSFSLTCLSCSIQVRISGICCFVLSFLWYSVLTFAWEN